MSPDPNQLKILTCDSKEINGGESKPIVSDVQTRTSTATGHPNDKYIKKTVNNNALAKNTEEFLANNDALVKAPTLCVSREKRNVPSPSINIHDIFVDPQSPSSSSSTSQTTSANDTTFEPTIEMMVNDFDDEQTLNEEEALAALESQDPDQEINTLKEESEMPLEELLAKYRALPHSSASFLEPLSKKSKKLSHKKKHKSKQKQEIALTPTFKDIPANFKDVDDTANTKIESINAESEDERYLPDDKSLDFGNNEANGKLSPQISSIPSGDEEKKLTSGIGNDNEIVLGEILKIRRSHLLDLYPEGTFDKVVVKDAIAGNSKDIPLETLYGVEDDEEDEEIEEEEDDDYKKKVMIGASYQATIPVGLSQYGDILPYENEDKLIWEPSQVSEREVEEYLIKIRDIKSNQQGEEEYNEESANETNAEIHQKENGISESNRTNSENNTLLVNGDKLHIETTASVDIDNQSVVKDNEQALHLLVQCGYDFKEALRRKRLNALPLNDCMSLWSEEECHKFEEGIQKYGKDFLKIRQNQVRTRTMRELVQFYYLWKKSERRDHNFANADTVDHMDIYLNEDNEYGSNPNSAVTPAGSPVGNNPNYTSAQRNNNSSQKNISIMSTTTTTLTNNPLSPATTTTSERNCSTISLQHHKRRAHVGNATNTTTTTQSDFNNENSVNLLTNFSK